MTPLFLLAQAAEAVPAADGGSGLWTMLLMIGGLFAVMYFLTIRPQKKEADRRKSMLEAVKVGDRVVTTGGFFGTIVKVQENSFMIELCEGTRAEIVKFGIAEVVNPQAEEKK